MTDWKKVTGTQPDKPEEVDRTSSPSTVYLRKNIEQVTREAVSYTHLKRIDRNYKSNLYEPMLQDDYIKQRFINASKKKKNRNDVREVLELSLIHILHRQFSV